jgi:hypothetical protein
VTIRFDFEASNFHLPAVFHRLVLLLTDILQCQHRLLDWHRNYAQLNEDVSQIHDDVVKSIVSELDSGRRSIWMFSVKALERLIDEHNQTPSAKSKNLFLSGSDGKGIDDTKWWLELDGTEDVIQLAQQFLSLRSEATGVFTNVENLVEMESSLRDKLFGLAQKNLRAVRVGAMNNIGMLLSKDDWSLLPISSVDSKGSDDGGENPEEFVQKVRSCERDFDPFSF